MFIVKRLGPGADLTDAWQVRKQVFVEEQGFSLDLEIDETDPCAHHVVLYQDKKPVATGRVFSSPEKPGVYIIGRVAALKECRGKGLGLQLMEELEASARDLRAREIILGAQCQARPFYERCGYEAYGEIYMDEHCPHIYMRKKIAG